MYLEFFGKPFVVLHSQAAAHELLEKHRKLPGDLTATNDTDKINASL